LRATLPIVVELEELRHTVCTHVDTFAKAAGWYRVLYGDLRHALDFRLMKGERVAILDASHSLYRVGSAGTSMGPPSATSSPSKSSVSSNRTGVGDGGAHLGLQPIPRFREIVADSVREVLATAGGVAAGRIALIDVGMVCDATAVQTITRVLHKQILQCLKGESS
jgi:mediator of RNA polymerase II transcription subunit 14